jgi:type II secretory pathway pseudopilin PulG
MSAEFGLGTLAHGTLRVSRDGALRRTGSSSDANVSSSGAGLAEVLISLALAGLAASWAAPEIAALRRGAALRAAAQGLGTEVRALRQEAAALSRYQALAFEQRDGRWMLQRLADGNRNGVRAAEVASGVDRRVGPPVDLQQRWGAVRPGLPGTALPRVPPARGALLPRGDPLQLSGTDRVSCAPDGSCTGGTIYLIAGGDEVAAVVVYGPTGRVRLWRFAPEVGTWMRY